MCDGAGAFEPENAAGAGIDARTIDRQSGVLEFFAGAGARIGMRFNFPDRCLVAIEP
jgi:hypothetical protein